MSRRPRAPRPQALAVDAELYRSDARVQGLVREAVGECLTEVRLWGEAWPAELDPQSGSVCHRLSVAARAFKTQALVAAAAPVDRVDGTETFKSTETFTNTETFASTLQSGDAAAHWAPLSTGARQPAKAR